MDIEQLREAVEEAGPSVPGRRFSPEVRAQLVRATHWLYGAGESLVDIAEALGVHVATVGRYLDEEPEDDGGDEGVAQLELPDSALVPVSVSTSPFSRPTVRVTTPDGFIVEGLAADEVAPLVRALR